MIVIMKRRHFTHFKIAGFTYYEGPVVFPELKVGTELSMKLEQENKFDPYAIALYFGEYKIGFVPKEENHTLHKFLEQGHDIFEVRIQQIAPAENTERQIQVIVYLLPAKVNPDPVPAG